MVAPTVYREVVDFVHVWQGLLVPKQPPEPEEGEVSMWLPPEAEALDEERIELWKLTWQTGLASWQKRVWQLFAAVPTARRRDLDEWIKSCKPREDLSPIALINQASDWFDRIRDTFTQEDWSLIFPEENPIEVIKIWRAECKRPKKRRVNYRETIHGWLCSLRERVLTYPQKVDEKLIKQHVTTHPQVGWCLSRMFASGTFMKRYTAYLTQYVFFKALGEHWGAHRPAVSKVRLGIDNHESREALLVLLLEEPRRAVPLIMLLDDDEWTIMMQSIESSRCVSTSFTDESVARERVSLLLYTLGSYQSYEPRTVARKACVFREVLAQVPEDPRGGLQYSAVFENIHARLSDSIPEALLALLHVCNSRRRSPASSTAVFNERVVGLLSKRMMNNGEFFSNCIIIFECLGVPPVDQVRYMRELLDKLPDGVLGGIQKRLQRDNKLAFVLAVAVPHKWKKLDTSLLGEWIKAAVPFTDEPKRMLRGYLELLPPDTCHYLTTLWLQLKPSESDPAAQFNLGHVLDQVPIHLGAVVDRDVLAFHSFFIKQLPPLMIYAGVKDRSQRYLPWIMKAFPVFEPCQAAAFFAALPDAHSPELEQVIGTFRNFGLAMEGGIPDGDIVAFLNVMDRRQQQVVFEHFKTHWEAVIARTQGTFRRLWSPRLSEMNAEELREVDLKFEGEKGVCRVLASYGHRRLLSTFRSFDPHDYDELMLRFEGVLRSEVVRLIDSDLKRYVVEEPCGIDQYIGCFTPRVSAGLEVLGVSPANLAPYGIGGDADLERIVGDYQFHVVLEESFQQVMIWAERLFLQKGRREGLSEEKAYKHAESRRNTWTRSFGTDQASDLRFMGELLEEDEVVPDYINKRVLAPLEELGYSLYHDETGRDALLQFIGFWNGNNFLAKLTLYLTQDEDLAALWGRLDRPSVSSLPPGVDVLQLSQLVVSEA